MDRILINSLGTNPGLALNCKPTIGVFIFSVTFDTEMQGRQN